MAFDAGPDRLGLNDRYLILSLLRTNVMKTLIKVLGITGSLLLYAGAQAQPYNRTLPAVVNDNNGNIF